MKLLSRSRLPRSDSGRRNWRFRVNDKRWGITILAGKDGMIFSSCGTTEVVPVPSEWTSGLAGLADYDVAVVDEELH